MNKQTKTIIITGATSGIGCSTAHLFAAKGYKVIITGRRSERLEALKKELEERYDAAVTILCFDVRDRQSTAASIEALPEEFRTIDILVNNAGLALGLEHFETGDHCDWDTMIDTNIKGLLNVTRIVAEGMAQRRSGHIINLGSTAGTDVYENGNVYCATKHAVHALSEAMRIDMLSKGIKVTEVRPGMVETEFSKVRFHGDDKRADGVYSGLKPLTPDDIAQIILWAVTQPDHVNINEVVVTPKAQANSYYTFRQQTDHNKQTKQ